MSELREAIDSTEELILVDGDPLTPGAVYSLDSELIEVQGQAYSNEVWPNREIAGGYNVRRGVGHSTRAAHDAEAPLTVAVPVYGETPLGGGGGAAGASRWVGPVELDWSDQENQFGAWVIPFDLPAAEGDLLLSVLYRNTSRFRNEPEDDIDTIAVELSTAMDSVRSAEIDSGGSTDTDIFEEWLRYSWSAQGGSGPIGGWLVGGEIADAHLVFNSMSTTLTQGHATLYFEVLTPPAA